MNGHSINYLVPTIRKKAPLKKQESGGIDKGGLLIYIYNMLKSLLLFLPLLCVLVAPAQISSTDKEFEAVPVGGREQLDLVLETQLTLPKVVLSSEFDLDFNLFFNIDTAGNAFNFKTDSRHYKVIEAETQRILSFLKFKRTLHLPDEPRPYFLPFHISRDKYQKYYKQRSRLSFKKPLPADSSYHVYSRADHSPEYYKGGEDGLKEFILTELEYPKIAAERSVEGTVIVEFVVETNGYITNLITKQGVNAGCTEEALRIIKQTKWQPAVLNNKLVRYRMSYPITFSLRNNMKDFGTSSGTTGQ